MIELFKWMFFFLIVFLVEIIENENIMKFIIAATIQLGINFRWIDASNDQCAWYAGSLWSVSLDFLLRKFFLDRSNSNNPTAKLLDSNSVWIRKFRKLAAKLVYHYYIPKMPEIESDSGGNKSLTVIKFMELVSFLNY